MRIKISECMWTGLREALFTRRDVETAGLLFGEPLDTVNGPMVAVREAFPVPEDAYRVRARDQLSIEPVALNRLTRPARDRGWSILTIHTHPGAKGAWFSLADDEGDRRLMPSFHCQIPRAPHGSIVVIESGEVVARAFSDGQFTEATVHVVGRVRTPLTAVPSASDTWFARQKLALGEWGHDQLRRLRVAVVGLGGIGSVVAAQLVHLGIGELILIDGDLVESSNVSRVFEAVPNDAGVTPKVDVAARYAKRLGLVKQVDPYHEYLGPHHAALLGSCDVIVGCVDQHSPRAVMNRVAYSHLVPFIDLGTAFRVDPYGRMTEDAGRVVVVGPDRPCLACWGHLDANAMRIEALAPAEREAEVEDGYIDGASVAQPAVIAFNTMVAGAGVVELLRLVTSFAGAGSPPTRLAFSFAAGTVRRNSLAEGTACSICGNRGTRKVA